MKTSIRVKKVAKTKETKKAKEAKKIKKATNVSLLFFPILLTGCVGMNSSFDCNVSSGGRCAPMDRIHKMADRGEFSDRVQSKALQKRIVAYKKRSSIYCPEASFVGYPNRSAEVIQKIWIGPYEDANGHYHEPSYVYSVVKKGEWIGEAKEVGEEI